MKKYERTKTEMPSRENLRHPFLQIAAVGVVGFNYDAVRHIYDLFNWRVTPIETHIQDWLKKGWLVGEPVYRYRASAHVKIAPLVWIDTLRGINPEELTDLRHTALTATKKGTFAMATLARALCLFLHNLPFTDELAAVDEEALFRDMTAVQPYWDCIVTQPELRAFLCQCPERVLSQCFYLLIPRLCRGEVFMEREELDQLFFDNERLPEPVRHLLRDNYLYNVEFLKHGRLESVLAEMDEQSGYAMSLKALLHLHHGQPEAALELFTTILKAMDIGYFVTPLENFAYAVALGLTNTSQAQKTAAKLLKDRKVFLLPTCYPLLLVLHHFFQQDADKFLRSYPLSNCTDNYSCLLATLFAAHYSLIPEDSKEIKAMGNLLATKGNDYNRLLCCEDFPALQPLAEKLHAQTGLTRGLLPPVRKLAPWERVIEELLRETSPAGNVKMQAKSSVEEMERVAYTVNTSSYGVQPKLQKSKDGGVTWSKGRNIAMRSFMAGGEDCMTTQDRSVARLVHAYSYGWYGGNVSYDLSGHKVIAALVGHPAVFNEATGVHLDIVEEPVQLTVQPCASGFQVRSNADLDKGHDGITIRAVGDKQLTVTRINEAQRKILTLLKTIGTFPAESKQRLTDLLQALSHGFTIMSPLLKNTTDIKRIPASPLIAVQITPSEGMHYAISLAVKPFGDHPPYQIPGRGAEIVSTTIDGESVQTERDLRSERRNLEAVRELMQPFTDDQMTEDHWLLDTEQCLLLLEALRTTTKVAFVEWPKGTKMRVVRPMLDTTNLRLSISSVGQWFELEGEINIGQREKIKMAELIERLHEGRGRFIRLSDDEYVALSDQLRRQLDVLDKMLVGRGKQLRVAAMNGPQLADMESLGAKVRADAPFHDLLKRIDEASTRDFPLPTNIHAELREYQRTGFLWMSRLAWWGAGACLADDMGLGKTLQAITLMQSRAAMGPQLVVMPTSVLPGWRYELMRFAPALTVHSLNQMGADRKAIVSEAAEGDVVLITYGLLVTEEELLASRTWTTVVLDEAHTIKNRDTQTSKGAMRLQADFRLLLTGTPLQNHLSEIWNLFQFANPGLLGTYQQFTERFILPIERDHDTERQRLLRRLLSPFMLRRTKEDVLAELPEKTEITLRIQLSPEEQALYDNLRQQAIANLEDNTGGAGALRALAEITRLRQAACHPRLIDDKLQISSSKTAAFLELVANLRQSGHRALVFSQFTSHLALVREELDRQQIPYLYLDGTTPTATRNRLVREFQTGDAPLFLISLKAGGLGLNLTAADYVVHLDPWWNPAIEDQASDRAHRIGQERPVTVYRLIAEGTIEEKILRLHASKRTMADALLAEADIFTQVNAADILRIIREGVEAL